MIESEKTTENGAKQRKIWEKPEVVDIDGEVENVIPGPITDMNDAFTS